MPAKSITNYPLLITLLFLSACAAPATPHPWSAADELMGSEWVLVELNGAAPMAGSHITLAFEADGVRGYAGCNWYGGPYLPVAPDEVAFTLTARACAEQALMDQEEVFVEVIQSAAARSLAGDRLEFSDAAGTTVAVFARQPQLDMDPAALVGTRWTLTRLAGAPPLGGTEITLVFDSATDLSGHAGCRDYHATYQAQGDDISLSFMEMLQLDCPDEARLLQEGEYTTLLGEATDYRLAEGELELYTASGRSLLFAAAP